MNKKSQIICAFVFGCTFVCALLVLALFIPNPTPYQYQTFRIVMALAAAGAAAMIPGFLKLEFDATANVLIRAGGALAVFVIVYFFNPAKLPERIDTNLNISPMSRETNTKWQPPELPPGCSNVFVSFGGQQLKIPMFVAKVSSEKIGTKVLFNDIPPEFSFFTNGYEKLPGYNASTSGMFFRVGSVQTTIEGRSVDYPILPYVRDNRLFVYVSMPFQNEKRIVSMSDDLDSVIPQTWDRNYSSNAFEVVNEDGRPVLQVFYKRPNDVQVNGVFIVNGYALFESFGAMPWLISPYVRVTQNQTTQEFEIADFQRTFTNIAISMDTNAAYGTKFTDQKPIFKYPAWKHSGQYAEE